MMALLQTIFSLRAKRT